MTYQSVARVFSTCLILTALWGHLSWAQAQDATPLIQIGQPGNLYSNVLQEDRPYWVHLPEDHSSENGKTYPVLYLLDGGQNLGGLAAIQTYYNHFRLPEMIVVAISNSENRTRDLTPTSVASRRGTPVEASGGAGAFRAFLTDELIPHIDTEYATTNHRVLVGHSYAGLFVIDTLLKQAGQFKNYIALDPSLDWDEGQWLDQSLENLGSLDLEGHSLFVAISNEIIRFSDTLTFETVASDTSSFSLSIRSQLAFVEAQESAGNDLDFAWKFYENDIHGSIPLVGMRDALVDMYDFWELKRPSLYNDPETPEEVILTLIKEQTQAQEQGMGYAQPMESELLEMLGGFYADIGQGQKAKGVLSLAADYYPETLSIRESIIDVCIALEDEPCAQNHARAADDLAGSGAFQEKVAAAFR